MGQQGQRAAALSNELQPAARNATLARPAASSGAEQQAPAAIQMNLSLAMSRPAAKGRLKCEGGALPPALAAWSAIGATDERSGNSVSSRLVMQT